MAQVFAVHHGLDAARWAAALKRAITEESGASDARQAAAEDASKLKLAELRAELKRRDGRYIADAYTACTLAMYTFLLTSSSV